MLIEIDRLQIATANPDLCIDRWRNLLGAEIDNVDRIPHLAATRTRLRLGVGYIEILQPHGEGVMADCVRKRGDHLYAAGAATQDTAALKQQLSAALNRPSEDFVVEDSSQLYIQGEDIGIPGLRVVISEYAQLPCVGEIDYLYEATLLAADAPQKTARFADVFNLDAQAFVEIDSPRFGYNGLLTLFRANQLHRFEVISPLQADNTMGRFFDKVGACLYMGFAETSNILAIEQRVMEQG